MRQLIVLALFALTSCGDSEIDNGFEQPPFEAFTGGCCTFPLAHKAARDYRLQPYAFGSPRDGGTRKHAGCDLIARAGTPIYAVSDGVVRDYYPFYSGTWAVEVDHGSFVARYGEVKGLKVPVGTRVTRGQLISQVGLLESGNSMLHFELYSGKGSGRLTVRENRPYQRRWDLLNPTEKLISWPYPVKGIHPVLEPFRVSFEND